jgi:hypothetical protein
VWNQWQYRAKARLWAGRLAGLCPVRGCRTPLMGEAFHRVVLLLLLMAFLACLFMGIEGAKVYVDSDRSVLKDLSTSVGYVWKKESCGDLYRIVAGLKDPGPNSGAMEELCETARKNSLPPLSLRSIIEDQLAASSEAQSRPVDLKQMGAILKESRKQLLRDLPALTAYFRPYQRKIDYMWLFIPAVACAVGAYFYARFFTPVLFGAACQRFERIMFGKSKVSDMWEEFIKPKKR